MEEPPISPQIPQANTVPQDLPVPQVSSLTTSEMSLKGILA